ncbi:unnamed protein product [Rhodiola kirilowii]
MDSENKMITTVGMSLAVILVSFIFYFLTWLLKKINVWLYEDTLPEEIRQRLPPGDLGWPLIGNMWPFLRAFKSTYPDAFTDSYISRFGNRGVYKCFMFGSPSILVTSPDANKRVLNDDQAFKPGWPVATENLMGKKSFTSIPFEEHKRLRKLTAAPVNGHEALSQYIPYIEENVKTALEEWSQMGKIEVLTELRKLTFKIIMFIFLGGEGENIMKGLENEYTVLNYGLRALAIDIPGFAYHKAFKARKKLVAIFQAVVDERRAKRRNGVTVKKDMMEYLLDIKDENGKGLTDEDVIDILLMYLNAGHESSGHITMWAADLLQAHPDIFHKANEEQERIVKERPPNQNELTLREIRKMEYLSMVVDETLRIVTFSPFVFREALKDFKIGDYIIPKGWKVVTWFRTVHYDPEVYPNPLQFNPDRWRGFVPKAGSFLPFSAGSRLCPGNDLAKLEISIFLHHFLLDYKLERENPKCPLMHLPHTRPYDNCYGKIRKVSA